jgi:ferric-dicitrate binding protein FerR (iron transport regulator)
MGDPITDGLGLDRFRSLAECYGGNIARWPIEEQAAARIRASKPEAEVILEEVARLDALLDLWNVRPLAAQQSHQAADKALSATRRLTQTARIWWAGIGVAAALSGAAAGTAMTGLVVTQQQTYGGTIFGDIDDDGDN